MRTMLAAAMGLVVCACDAAEAPRPGEVRVAFDVESMWLEGVTGFTARVSQADAPDAAREVTVDFAALEFFEPFETALGCERGAVTITVEAIGGECEQPRQLTRVMACPEGGSSDVVLGGADFPKPTPVAYPLSLCMPDFDEPFCSGKVEVSDILHDPVTAQREPTLFATTACTSGSADFTLYATDVQLRCGERTVALPLDDAIGTGPAYPPLVDLSANYGGVELVGADITKRFRSGAWLLSAEARAAVCTLDVAFVFAANELPDARVNERSSPMHVMGYRLAAIIEDGIVRPSEGDALLQRLTTREMAALELEALPESQPTAEPTHAR